MCAWGGVGGPAYLKGGGGLFNIFSLKLGWGEGANSKGSTYLKGTLIRAFTVISLHTIPKKRCFTCNSVVRTKINFLLFVKYCFFKFFTKCKREKTQGYFSVS